MGRGEGPLSTHLGRRPTPHNNRCRLYADDPVDEDDDNYGAAILCIEFADLPIPIRSVQVITDGKGVPLSIPREPLRPL